MELTDLKKLSEQFNTLKQTFGWVAAISLLLLAALLFLAWKFVIKKIEKAAEVASEKSLKKFQAQIDQDNTRFQTQHEKQIDALENLYKHFEALSSVIKYTMKGEKFTADMGAQEQVHMLIRYRHDFKHSFHQNRLRLKTELCDRIEALLPIVDEFIETFEGGIMPGGPPEVPEGEEPNELYIAAIWPAGLLDGIINRIDVIASAIETDFRTAYGTAQ